MSSPLRDACCHQERSSSTEERAEEEGEGLACLCNNVVTRRMGIQLPSPFHGVCTLHEGWGQLPQPLSSKMEVEHETVRWILGFPAQQMPTAAAQAPLTPPVGSESCSAPGGTLPTVGCLLKEVPTRQWGVKTSGNQHCTRGLKVSTHENSGKSCIKRK